MACSNQELRPLVQLQLAILILSFCRTPTLHCWFPPLQPVAIVAFVGRDHVYAKTGRAAGAGLARSLSICQWTLVPMRHEVFVVPDTLQDGRWAPSAIWLPEYNIIQCKFQLLYIVKFTSLHWWSLHWSPGARQPGA